MMLDDSEKALAKIADIVFPPYDFKVQPAAKCAVTVWIDFNDGSPRKQGGMVIFRNDDVETQLDLLMKETIKQIEGEISATSKVQVGVTGFRGRIRGWLSPFRRRR